MPYSEAAVKFAINNFLELASKKYSALAVKRAILVNGSCSKWPKICYIAADFNSTRTGIVGTHAAGVPLRYCKKYGALSVCEPKIECFGMPADNCPPYILEVLSPPATKTSSQWRYKCASEPWRYELLISKKRNNHSDFHVILGKNEDAALVDHSLDVPPWAFDAEYERLISEYQMASIRPLRFS